MAAFEQAVADGADGIEFDLRLSADRKWVVHHNADVLIGGAPARLSQLTLKEIVQIPLGTNGERIPSVAEFLTWAKRGSTPLMFDLKDTDGIKELVETIDTAGMTSPATYSSFSRSAIRAIKRFRPEWRTALIVDDPRWNLLRRFLSGWLFKSARRESVDALHLHERWVTPSLVVAARDAGIGLAIWTVDDPLRMTVLASLGIDAIITNDPALGRKTIDQMNH